MKKRDENNDIAKALALFTQLGFAMAACVFTGVLVGKLLDQWLGTSPWLLVVCALLGGIASFKVLYDIAIRDWL